MAMEPMTLFARIADPAGVARLLRERVPTVEIDGLDGGWGNTVVTFGTRKLTFTHDPAYYAEPNWSVQMDGMRGCFSRFPQTDRKDLALMLTTTFKFSLGLLFDPDYDPDRTSGKSCNARRAGLTKSSRSIRPGAWKGWASWRGHSADSTSRRTISWSSVILFGIALACLTLPLAKASW